MGSPTHSLSAGVQSIVNLKRNDLLRTLLFCAVHNVPQLCALLQPFPEFQAFEQKLMDLTAPSKVNDIIAAVNIPGNAPKCDERLATLTHAHRDAVLAIATTLITHSFSSRGNPRSVKCEGDKLRLFLASLSRSEMQPVGEAFHFTQTLRKLERGRLNQARARAKSKCDALPCN